MMWQQPKTDWQAADDVLCSDYNRIKGNIEFLKELAYTLYFPFPINEMGEDKAEEEYPYADEINTIVDNLELLAAGSYHVDIGKKVVYEENGPYIAYQDLNRIESATLQLYENMNRIKAAKGRLPFRLGTRRDPF